MSLIEAELLDKINAGLLEMRGGDVWFYHGSHKKWVKKKPKYHEKSGRAKCCWGPKRQTVYQNRLIWMLTHKQAIPDGYYVDHTNGNRYDDSPGNLQLMRAVDSHRQGQEKGKDTTLDRLGRWFAFVGEQGREPTGCMELAWVETGF